MLPSLFSNYNSPLLLRPFLHHNL
ncbi:hypothetical protein NC653_012504 [Populus alba x Populus x berolinensis]|uniref:Uncharacterized protein n=1 Tax=Populus alba x Populus x berolinensis TaxID=444605 RepID=A0AAD6W1X7_9ROSI|nr:hypothetical protein NC653_012504 [Populus alba x Populus x berolinensis]